MLKKMLWPLASLVFLAGCASGPITAGLPGHQAEVGPQPTLERSAASEPGFCVVSVQSMWPSQRFFHYEAFAANASFRDIRLLTDNHPGPQGCDVLLKLFTPGRTAWSTHRVEAYSAYTRELVWEGSAPGQTNAMGYMRLAPVLQRAFQPGQPAYERIAADKKAGHAPTVDDVEHSFGGLTPEAGEYGLGAFPNVRVGARPQETPVAAAVPVHAPALAPAPESPPTTSDVDEPPAASGLKRGHAVIVGVERYRGNLPKADYAVSDAKTMARYAHAVLGYPEENIALLTGETATRSDLVKYLEKWLANRVEKDDEVFVYFSGHGAPDVKTGDAYLVPYDGDPAYLEETGYSVKKLYAALAALPARKVTAVLDSCFSGAGGRSVIAKGARPLVTVKAADAPAGVTVIAAAGAGQVSNTYDEKGHGLFTYFLLKGMKERGSDLKLVFDYLKPEVARVARREYNADQEPQWREGR